MNFYVDINFFIFSYYIYAHWNLQLYIVINYTPVNFRYFDLMIKICRPLMVISLPERVNLMYFSTTVGGSGMNSSDTWEVFFFVVFSCKIMSNDPNMSSAAFMFSLVWGQFCSWFVDTTSLMWLYEVPKIIFCIFWAYTARK